MSEVESTTNDKGLKEFWTPYSKEISKKLWLPTKIDGVDSGSISSNGCSSDSMLKLSLLNESETITTQNLLTTSWNLSQFSQQDTTAPENTLITRKIRLFPSKRQKLLFNNLFKIHRYLYNKSIAEINGRYKTRYDEFVANPTCVLCNSPKTEGLTCNEHKNEKLPWKLNISEFAMRDKIMATKENITDGERWLLEAPHNTREAAVFEAIKNYKTCCTQKINNAIDKFELGFKSCKSPTRIFIVAKDAIIKKDKNIHIFTRRLKEKKVINITTEKTKTAKKVPYTFNKTKPKEVTVDYSKLKICKNDMKYFTGEHLDYEAKILFDRGSYYLLLVIEKETIKIVHQYDACALDPGEHTFQTLYSPSGILEKFGNKMSREIIQPIFDKIDKLKSVMTNAFSKTRRNIKRRLSKLQKRIRDLISELHNKTSVDMAKRFNSILLPDMGTSLMLEGNSLKPSTKRNLQSLSQCKFKNKLSEICKKYGSDCIITAEPYTTKTCGNCGQQNKPQSNRVYLCSSCSLAIDRDVNGARNIFIRYLTINKK